MEGFHQGHHKAVARVLDAELAQAAAPSLRMPLGTPTRLSTTSLGAASPVTPVGSAVPGIVRFGSAVAPSRSTDATSAGTSGIPGTAWTPQRRLCLSSTRRPQEPIAPAPRMRPVPSKPMATTYQPEPLRMPMATTGRMVAPRTAAVPSTNVAPVPTAGSVRILQAPGVPGQNHATPTSAPFPQLPSSSQAIYAAEKAEEEMAEACQNFASFIRGRGKILRFEAVLLESKDENRSFVFNFNFFDGTLSIDETLKRERVTGRFLDMGAHPNMETGGLFSLEDMKKGNTVTVYNHQFEMRGPADTHTRKQYWMNKDLRKPRIGIIAEEKGRREKEAVEKEEKEEEEQEDSRTAPSQSESGQFDVTAVKEKLRESMLQQSPVVRDIRGIFRCLDIEQKNELTFAEFKQGLEKFGFKLSDEQAKLVIETHYKSQEDKVEYKNFCDALLNDGYKAEKTSKAPVVAAAVRLSSQESDAERLSIYEVDTNADDDVDMKLEEIITSLGNLRLLESPMCSIMQQRLDAIMVMKGSIFVVVFHHDSVLGPQLAEFLQATLNVVLTQVLSTLLLGNESSLAQDAAKILSGIQKMEKMEADRAEQVTKADVDTLFAEDLPADDNDAATAQEIRKYEEHIAESPGTVEVPTGFADYARRAEETTTAVAAGTERKEQFPYAMVKKQRLATSTMSPMSFAAKRHWAALTPEQRTARLSPLLQSKKGRR